MAASPDKHYQARILERRDLSPDLWIIRIDPGGPFEFRAGQYATLGVEHEGKRLERAYSIVSSPYEDSLEFFVELVPHGDLTPDLFKLKTGDGFTYRFVEPDPSGAWVLFDAGPSSRGINGWIDRGKLVPLKPAGNRAFDEVWSPDLDGSTAS